MTFTLHPRLEADTASVKEQALCRVLLMNCTNFPWLVLVPRVENIREIYELSPQDYLQCMQDVRSVTQKLAAYTKADKMNVATLGNMVPQLHIHIIARFKNDSAWPNPVWGSNLQHYDADVLRQKAQKFAEILGLS